MNRILLVLATVATLGLASAQTIVDIAAGNEDFETLVAAVQAAGLVDTLSGDGPFTVFAPTDAAFDALPAGTVEALLADIPTLTAILTYHVVPGAVLAEDVVGLRSATTVQGEDVTITTDGMGVRVNSANVVATDIVASNGVIHVIDAVILPPTLANAGVFSITYPVAEVAGSGVGGTVRIDSLGNQKSLVTVALDGTPAGGNHPMHFHAGDCGSGGGVVVPLENVDGDTGVSVTVIDAPINVVIDNNHYLNVHLSPDAISTIVACGEVGAGAPSN